VPPVPFGEQPTLRDFIEKAQELGAELKQSPTVMDGPNGPVRFAYLWFDADRFVPLPNLSYDEHLPPDVVDHMARRRLKLPTEEFWPGFTGYGFADDDDPNPELT
jgi:hypothetical protein